MPGLTKVGDIPVVKPGNRKNVRDSAADKALGAFKLELLETVNADPQMKPSDLKVIDAYLVYLKKSDMTAWVASSQLRARTNLSETSTAASRKRLCQAGYLRFHSMRNNIKVYKVQNPRAGLVSRHVKDRAKKFREQEAARRSKRRSRLNVPPKSVGTNREGSAKKSECPTKICGAVPPKTKGESLEESLEFIAVKKEAATNRLNSSPGSAPVAETARYLVEGPRYDEKDLGAVANAIGKDGWNILVGVSEATLAGLAKEFEETGNLSAMAIAAARQELERAGSTESDSSE